VWAGTEMIVWGVTMRSFRCSLTAAGGIAHNQDRRQRLHQLQLRCRAPQLRQHQRRQLRLEQHLHQG
jgi:hypothetical protein